MPRAEAVLGVPSRAVRKPLESLAQAVRELEIVSAHSLQEFREGIYVRRAAERLVQLGVDLACELGACLLLGRNKNLKLQGYEETFQLLGEKGFVSPQMAEKLVSSAELRRRIVFACDDRQDDDLHRRLPFVTVLLKEFGRSVERALGSAETAANNGN